MRLKGKSVVITGATGAIGSATAKRFLSEGANIVLVGRSEDKLRSLSESLNHSKAITTCVAEALDEAADVLPVPRRARLPPSHHLCSLPRLAVWGVVKGS